MAHDLFISYCHHNKVHADATCAVLEEEGLRCWIAPRDIIPGSEWTESVLEGISGSKAMVLMFSQQANDSPQVRREVERAVHHGIPVVPIRLEDVMPTRAMEYLISTPHWMDAITPPLDAHLRKLAASLKTLLETIPPGAVLTGNNVHGNLVQQATIPRRNRRLISVAAGSLALILILAGSFGLYFLTHRVRANGGAVVVTPSPSNSLAQPSASPASPIPIDNSARAASLPISSAPLNSLPPRDSIEAGNAQLKIGDYAGAIATFTTAINADKTNATAWMGRGIAAVKLGC